MASQSGWKRERYSSICPFAAVVEGMAGTTCLPRAELVGCQVKPAAAPVSTLTLTPAGLTQPACRATACTNEQDVTAVRIRCMPEAALKLHKPPGHSLFAQAGARHSVRLRATTTDAKEEISATDAKPPGVDIAVRSCTDPFTQRSSDS